MKTIFKSIGLVTLALSLGCDAADEDRGISADEAGRTAEAAVGGEAGERERVTDGDLTVWRVELAMANGASVEVRIDVDSGEVVEAFDKVGPFDYPDFTPMAGVLSYEAITAKAVAEVDGEVEAWICERIPDGDAFEFQWELYVRDADAQLWEIKFDAESGEPTHLEPADMVD